MQQKGEFEQRPEVKPAEQVPLPKAKASPLPWILCVILLLAAGGLLAWKLLDKGDNKLQCETAIEKDNKDEKNDSASKSDSGGDSDLLGGYDKYVSFADAVYVDKDGNAYYAAKESNYSWLKPKIENAEVLGEYGEYTIWPEMGSDGKETGYKLPFKNVAYAEVIRFGQGGMDRYIIVIDKEQNLSAIALDEYATSRENLDQTVTMEARKIGELKEYKGAVAVQATNDGSGIGNQVIFKDGSRKAMDHKLFYKEKKFKY